MPKRVPLDIWKGNTLQRVFAFKNKDGSSVDVTGWEVVFRMVWPAGQGVTAGTLRKSTAGGGGLAMDASAGSVTLVLTPVDTRLIPTGTSAKYELELHYGGVETTLLYGEVTAEEWANDDV